jgi:hypothetical protein
LWRRNMALFCSEWIVYSFLTVGRIH